MNTVMAIDTCSLLKHLSRFSMILATIFLISDYFPSLTTQTILSASENSTAVKFANKKQFAYQSDLQNQMQVAKMNAKKRRLQQKLRSSGVRRARKIYQRHSPRFYVLSHYRHRYFQRHHFCRKGPLPWPRFKKSRNGCRNKILMCTR